MTLADLLAYAREQATISVSDYFDPRYDKPEEVRAWRTDKSRRDRQRRKVLAAFPARLRNADREPLEPGRYAGSRLIIGQNGSVEYIPGQYSALEIWAAVFDYLTVTNACEADR